MDFTLSLHWQLNDQHIDPKLFALLNSIVNLGSLQQACAQLDIPYRSAWGLLSKWEGVLGKPLVLMEKGRGSVLTELGAQLLQTQSQLNARLQPTLDNESLTLSRNLQRLLEQQTSEKLTIFASHGLAIGELRDQLKLAQDTPVDLHFHGSLESLRAFADGECDLAGFHIPIGPLNRTLRAQYLRYLDQDKTQLIYVVRRNQGLMQSPALPEPITQLEQLTNTSLRFINRQTGSGTRILFDQLLALASLEPANIAGYDTVEFTHMAVAAMIASGEADVGFGIAPMADRFRLHFQPIVWEHYCLAVAKEKMESPAMRSVVSCLSSQNFADALGEYRGYQIDQAGQLIDFDAIFID